jgi:hypothetical protein
VVRVGLGADDPLDGEAHVDEVAVAGDVHVLEVVQQRQLPPYHGMCSLRSTTLSPCSAEIGMKVMSVVCFASRSR